jgi:hypothetical protein
VVPELVRTRPRYGVAVSIAVWSWDVATRRDGPSVRLPQLRLAWSRGAADPKTYLRNDKADRPPEQDFPPRRPALNAYR